MRFGDTVGSVAHRAPRGTGGRRSTQRFFGPAQTVGATTVIPVAEARLRLQAGAGGGLAWRGPGAAGIGMVQVEPVGFITVRGQRADFTPIRDYTRLILRTLGWATVLLPVLAALVALVARRRTESGESPDRRRG